ncbi:MAG: coproporphyrinogen dehydrogenase HemZ, partial [Eubacterium sp.]|nr:coproporphyrinogen dehydrogenase HemZ [Eubacterium sp.]
ICLYCSFGSHPLERWKEQVEDYLEALKKELRAIAQMMNEKRLDTIYIGGGTPTSLSENQLEKLMDMVTEIFDIRQLSEFTVEAGRPDTITKKKLQILKGHGVSRISVNPQTMNEKTLERIGRKHTVIETTDAFALAREEGFDNINMDLIIGLPGEGERDVAYTLGEIKKLSPDSLTIHSLALKRATRLNLFREEYESDAFVNSEEIMEMTKACAEEMGMHPYYLYRQKNIAGNFENTGYAREGKEGLYNILIMEQRQMIVAAGSGASTKLFADGGRIIRIENVKDLTQYLERVDEMIEKKRSGLNALRSGA